MPWDGVGNFTRLYNFVADALANIKILAQKQDNEWNNMVGGINNVLTRDGQNSPSADIPWGAHKITGLAPGTAPTDAANLSQVASTEWVDETAGIAYVSTTSFKILGADFTEGGTGRWHIGRRFKCANTGGTRYGTIASSSYSAPDTTVTCVCDGAGNTIDSGIDDLQYAVTSNVNPSVRSPRSVVLAYGSAPQSLVLNTITKLVNNTESIDALGEYDSVTNFRFTPKYPTDASESLGPVYATYTLNAFCYVNNGANTGYFDLFLILNGDTANPIAWSQRLMVANTREIMQCTITYPMPTNTSYIEVWVRAQMAGCAAGGPLGVLATQFAAMRVQ